MRTKSRCFRRQVDVPGEIKKGKCMGAHKIHFQVKNPDQQWLYSPTLVIWPALPPTSEQYRIATKVNELMALCDQLRSILKDAHRPTPPGRCHHPTGNRLKEVIMTEQSNSACKQDDHRYFEFTATEKEIFEQADNFRKYQVRL